MALAPVLKKPGSISSPSALKVAFQVPTAEEIDVAASLKEAAENNGQGMLYRSLINAVKSQETSDAALIHLLRRIRKHMQLIARHNDDICGALLKINLMQRSREVLDAFARLALDLTSLHPYYLRNLVFAILRIFMSPDAYSEDASVVDREEKLATLHHIIQEIIRLVPLSPKTIVSSVAEMFPYLKHDGREQASLVRHLLRLCTYLPDQHLELLQLIVHKALQLDLHSPKEEIEDCEDEDEDEAIFSMDGNSKEKDAGGLKHPLADTLDRVMLQVYMFIDDQCGVTGKGQVTDWEKTKALFKDFLAIFDRIILPTYKCCHLQFVMFYLSSLKPALLEGFLDYLWKKVQNPNTAPVIRQAAAFYIGSLLARGKFVPLSTVQDCLALLCKWAHFYVTSHGEGAVQADVRRHGTFYAVCQTVLYIFAFHHKDLTATNKGLQFLRSLNLEALVMSPLNPLRVCLPAVVQRFANVARHYQLVYCYTLLERNRRNAFPEATAENAPTTLECFFPFDPYLLPRTGKYIHPLYRQFEGSAEETDEEMEEEEGSIVEDDPKSPAGSVVDMFSYGTSPGFKQVHSGPLR
ncbi:RNA polymerase I-specific transcription initiation factor RRN3-like [Ornithodoros turicata]|uniref:RNA polymerase I-specific transcription initiation factor RRN3-like n=1 Tax=Ornithodoros turicata TaxID=34597 RepID=UPI0031387BCB